MGISADLSSPLKKCFVAETAGTSVDSSRISDPAGFAQREACDRETLRTVVASDPPRDTSSLVSRPLGDPGALELLNGEEGA